MDQRGHNAQTRLVQRVVSVKSLDVTLGTLYRGANPGGCKRRGDGICWKGGEPQ